MGHALFSFYLFMYLNLPAQHTEELASSANILFLFVKTITDDFCLLQLITVTQALPQKILSYCSLSLGYYCN
jgi:hypothetical protein